MEIRNARLTDLDEIMPIYDRARAYMAANGNAGQWSGGYPSRADITADIQAGNCYVCTEGGQILGVFALIFGEDATYKSIENGSWLKDESYAAIHRIAASGVRPGIAKFCFAWSEQLSNSRGAGLRIDTHADNKTMRHVLEAYGFQECGIIRLKDGSPRIAYQKLFG